jgi:hypothetical protein
MIDPTLAVQQPVDIGLNNNVTESVAGGRPAGWKPAHRRQESQ